jgi:hypothetical protein
LTKLKLDF